MKRKTIGAMLCCLMLLSACQVRDHGSPDTGVSPKTVKDYKEMSEAMRTAIPKENILMEDDSDTVFGSEYDRDEIDAVIFGKNVKKVPKDSWDVSQDGNGSVLAWVEETEDGLQLHIAGKNGVRAPENCRNLFAGYTDAVSFDFGDGFDTSAAEDMSGMFRDCASVEDTLDLSSFQTGAVTDMAGMFAGMERVEEINLRFFDTGAVTDMSEMFRDCGCETLDLESFDTEKVRNMREMFAGSSLSTLDLTSFQTEQVTDMSGMFRDCAALETLDISNFRTGKVKSMQAMFENCGCETLDLSGLDTAAVTDMSRMFAGCEKVVNLDLSGFDTWKVETMADMFRDCTELVTVDVSSFDTSAVTDMGGMFYDCNMLDTPDLRHFDVSLVEEYDSFMSPGVEVNGEPWQAMFTAKHHLTFK